MIFIGLPDAEKQAQITAYTTVHGIEHIVIISGDATPLPFDGAKQVQYSDVIMYATFYPLLQEIKQETLVVINECLRTQNRYDLSYNCIRHYLNQAGHQLIFQRLPQIDTCEDFMILFDFDTQSRWKRYKFDARLIADEAQVVVREFPLAFHKIEVETSSKTQQQYRREREKLFATIGNRDPHIIPRQLHLVGTADKKTYIQGHTLPLFALDEWFVARNQRLKLDCVVTYNEVEADKQYTLVDFPHRFIDFSDFIARTGQFCNKALVADLKVDQWYFRRYIEWSERIHETCASLHCD